MKNWQSQGLAVLRILTGMLMAYHGLEIFDSEKMAEYAKWEVVQTLPSPLLMVYLGKGIELVTGVLLTVGLMTRPYFRDNYENRSLFPGRRCHYPGRWEND